MHLRRIRLSDWLSLSTAVLLPFSSVSAQEEKPHQAALPVPRSETSNKESPILFGRIQELFSGSGARLPIPLQPMDPIRDNSLDEKLSGSSSKQSYPLDFHGTWSGDLTVIANKFDKTFWEFDPVEAESQKDLLKPGTVGRCTVSFEKSKDGSVDLAPCHVLFAETIAASDQKRYYALHLGDLNAGCGVTGNELSCELKKNVIKEPSESVVEQEIVTHDTDRNPQTKKIHTGYTENVLRFTRIDAGHLVLQAASVSYDSNGKFQNKVILNGKLSRVNSYPVPF